MNPAFSRLFTSLQELSENQTAATGDLAGAVGAIARVYEVARNALEYRADHLVRRAAVERILRRQLLFDTNAAILAEQLLQELEWAFYLTSVNEQQVKPEQIAEFLTQYIPLLSNPVVPRDWLIGLISAHIEELFNPNNNYRQFTLLAYQILRPKIEDPHLDNADLLLFVAVEKVYAQADDQQIAYRLFSLLRRQMPDQTSLAQIAVETWKQIQSALLHPEISRVTSYVRKMSGPLILLRDVYFVFPTTYQTLLESRTEFLEKSTQVLRQQLLGLRGRMNRASQRALLSVFLSKILIVMLIELPIEKFLSDGINVFRLASTILFPVGVMAILTAAMSLPKIKEQQRLVDAAWAIVSDTESDYTHNTLKTKQSRSKLQTLFGGVYAVIFVATFALLLLGLKAFGYGLINSMVFVFFLCLVCFFAYRIQQTGVGYRYSPQTKRTGIIDILLLPVVTVGGWFSLGIAKLNVVIFVFDFLLEAPLKLVLRFTDRWFSFLSTKKDEAVG